MLNKLNAVTKNPSIRLLNTRLVSILCATKLVYY